MKKSKKPKEDKVVIGFISNQGITLITLVITIIIMLILSGIRKWRNHNKNKRGEEKTNNCRGKRKNRCRVTKCSSRSNRKR